MNSYRSVLEVLKFLCPEAALRHTCFVTRTWTRASESPELWHIFNEDVDCPIQSRPPKEAHRLKEYGKKSLVLIRPESMKTFNCRKLVWSPEVRLSSTVEVYYNSAIVMLADGNVLACGGGVRVEDSLFREQPLNSACRILSDGTVHPLCQLLTPRMLHGIIEVRSFVYVFGGISDKRGTLSCEKLEIDYCNTVSGTRWTPLPDMLTIAWGFNPCLLNTRIFIGGRTPTDLVGMEFDILTNSFEYSKVKLTGHGYQGSAFLHSEDLMILQVTYLTTWRTSDGSVKESISCTSGVFSYGAQNPVVDDDRLYHLDQVGGCIYCLNLSSGKSVPLPANRLR